VKPPGHLAEAHVVFINGPAAHTQNDDSIFPPSDKHENAVLIPGRLALSEVFLPSFSIAGKSQKNCFASIKSLYMNLKVFNNTTNTIKSEEAFTCP